MSDAYTVWSTLPLPWQRAFEAAWDSWRVGSAGVGAAVTDAEGTIVATGQNRMMDPPGGPGPLAGIPMAHAEMNALATLAPGVHGYAVFTTFEPCLMCTATITGTYHIPKVAFAAYDPTWDGLFEALLQYPTVAARRPEREHLGGPYGTLAYVLHLTGLMRHSTGPFAAHERLAAARLALCRRLLAEGAFERFSGTGAVVADVAAGLWDDLEQLADA